MKDKVLARVLGGLAERQGALFPFLPVFMGIGIGLWFSVRNEPSGLAYGGIGIIAGGGLWLALRGPYFWRVPAWALAFVAFGFLCIGFRAWLAEAPVLDWRYYGAVEGRVVEIDRSGTDKLRLTLDRVVLERTDPAKVPHHVRVSLHGDQSYFTPQPGTRVMMTAFLGPPMPPSEPGGFDFRRMAWFDRLGAVGYTRTPVLTLENPEAGTRIISRLRAALSQTVQSHIHGQVGAFVSGSVTGDRSGITQDTVVALRDSNLSHLLAISGMNLAFLVTFTFAVLRYGFALIPMVALRLNTKKLAAVASLGVAGFYLALSGGNVATERAFIMSAIMLGAILCDRRALSLRTVALSGLILLTLQPEALINAGFQMSMAATVGLVWGFGLVDRLTFREKLPKWSVPVYAAVLSSLIGGMATGPIAAAQFNRYAEYGLVANLLTVPAMGTLIMPGAVVASILGPIGLPQPGMWMMQAGGYWILAVAHWIAGWGGAVRGITAPSGIVLPMMFLGALWGILWQGRARFVGLAVVGLAFGLWGISPRPMVLVSDDGALVGVLGDAGRILSSPRAAGFAADSWLIRDGDIATQEKAADRPGFSGEGSMRRITLPAGDLVHLKGKGAEARLAEACEGAMIVILAARASAIPEGCNVLDQARLEKTGAVALQAGQGGITIIPTQNGQRVWSRGRH
ncbi:ComEC/Rec2 family competence protein [Falsirhodobacter sp. alg1]|uniref:ComEC/Rec2 family competence protein n=1 Tax=Falsirhodobacter sp. alg1 TaxID=1472418 RepID=UPI0007899631|nr:ComEC/Rec2 family competence protein [Falsirhodobacter sp. alg1]